MTSNHQSGFTFIELMVVITIVAIMAGATAQSLRVDPKTYNIKETSEHMNRTFGRLYQRAFVEEQAYGVVIGDEQFFTRLYNQEGVWLDMADKQAEENQFADNMLTDIRLDRSNPSLFPRRSTGTPDIVFMGDGTYTPFSLTLSYEDDDINPITLVGDGINPVVIE